MKLKEMTDAEQMALGTLVRKMVGIDGEFSSEEAASLEQVATDLGTDDFWQLIQSAGQQDLGDHALKARATAVDRPEVQKAIYATLFGVAAAGTIVATESTLLDWLAEAWGLERS